MKSHIKKHNRFDLRFITSSISITLVLLLVGLVVVFVSGAQNLSTFVKENVNVSVFLQSDLNDAEIVAFQQTVDSQPFTKQTRYISKAEALQELKKSMGADPEEFLGHNPLPASLDLRLKADYANPDSLKKVEMILMQDKRVQDINYQKELIDALHENLRNITLILVGMAVILALISFALINNTIRLTIYSKRFLIHTMKLVGANWSFIRKPFLLKSFWIGVFSATIAAGLLFSGYYWLLYYRPQLSVVITLGNMWAVVLCVYIFGILLTRICTLLSLNKFLKMKASELHYL